MLIFALPEFTVNGCLWPLFMADFGLSHCSMVLQQSE
jgi:hypothetical protein